MKQYVSWAAVLLLLLSCKVSNALAGKTRRISVDLYLGSSSVTGITG